eukprot:6352808-Amphidinium_carterae.1
MRVPDHLAALVGKTCLILYLVNRVKVYGTVDVGTNYVAIAAGTALNALDVIEVYTGNAQGLQTTPTVAFLVDDTGSAPTVSVTSLEFDDTDITLGLTEMS